MALTGRADGPPLGPPTPLVPRLHDVARRIARRSEVLGRPVELDTLELLGERAAIAALSRQGDTSCGGSTRLLAGLDGWIAVTLARPEDEELVPAWLEIDRQPLADLWRCVADEISRRSVGEVTERGWLLGLPVAPLASTRPSWPRPVRAVRLGGPPPPAVPLADIVVVDLSSLWAGPLCASVLHLAGAQVVKVESARRPDGSRRGPAAFFDLLNAGKRSVVLDFPDPGHRQALHRLVRDADVVVEATRPRALEQLGLVAEEVVAGGGPRVWVSITGYGRTTLHRDRVAFGDDAAIGGGLAVFDERGPCFCADAVADPATGLVAAAACLDALAAGGRWLLDVAMAGVAGTLSGPTLAVEQGLTVAPPHARASVAGAA